MTVPTAAYRVVVTDPPGEPTTLTLFAGDPDVPPLAMVLGSADCVRVASDLLKSAVRRLGRLTPAEMEADSKASYDEALRAKRAGKDAGGHDLPEIMP